MTALNHINNAARICAGAASSKRWPSWLEASFAAMWLGTAVSGQTLETFTTTVRPSDTYFATGWSSGAGAPNAAFAQGAGVYTISGATNGSGGYMDMYLAAPGRTVDIGVNRCAGVSARTLPGNQARSFRIFLIDAAGRSASATFLSAEFIGETPQAIGRALSMERGFDTRKVERLRISGDELEGASPFAIAFNEIAAVGAEGVFDGSVLRNVSARGAVGTGANVLVGGFVVNGTAPKQLLVRAAGPALQSFGIASPLADPNLQLFRGASQIAGNDNWAGDAATTSAFNKVRAFPFAAGSRDSALVTPVAPGASTLQVKGVGDTVGEALLEAYDQDDLSATFPEPRIVNASARGVVGPNQPPLIVGFIIKGTAPKTLLIRACGPALASFGLSTGFEADPELKLVDASGATVASNDNWGTAGGSIAATAQSAGAFPLTQGSRDAAVLVTLAPGAYAAVTTGISGTGGIVLVELYEAPPGTK